MPKISVIMGVFNTSKQYVKVAIESILNQTYKDFEFIICNDCCTDDTFEYIKKCYKNEERIILIENECNKGLAYTLNHCLKMAKGEYIARMDADDESMLDRFEKQLNFLESNKDYQLVATCVNLFDDKGIWGDRCFKSEVEKEDFLFNSPIVHPSIMAKREVFDCVDNYKDVKYTLRNEDYDIFMRMLAKGIKMYIMPEKLLNFREDKNASKRRKYRFRINEAIVRYYNFKELKISYTKRIIYTIKPLIVGLIPYRLLKFIKLKKEIYSKI